MLVPTIIPRLAFLLDCACIGQKTFQSNELFDEHENYRVKYMCLKGVTDLRLALLLTLIIY